MHFENSYKDPIVETPSKYNTERDTDQVVTPNVHISNQYLPP
jgi:hypothetical protein